MLLLSNFIFSAYYFSTTSHFLSFIVFHLSLSFCWLMSSFTNTFLILSLLIFHYFPVSQAGRYKSYSDFNRHLKRTTSSSTTTPLSSTKPTMATEATKNIDLTLLEKIITGLISSLVTTFGSVACVCVLKCYRNNGQCKVCHCINLLKM
jgi:hypothetical protein